ncbi:LamG-like jellyroll fold domain-containing protein [Imperialibacter sp.]|uniref:LamG-like jellyroll fold domain-containing protein n=1 Tax=Imperialibacter sp. TaxID=2038411 RepID=UPI0032EE9D91
MKLSNLFSVLFITSVGSILIVSCGKDEEEPKVLVPGILTITPNIGLEGDTVRILVEDFDGIGESCEVYFSGIKGTKIGFEGDNLEVVVPSGAETGMVSIAADTIELEGPVFTYLPVIDEIDRLIQRVGDTVRVSGRHFAAIASDNQILFNDSRPTTPISASRNKMEVVVPSDASSGKLTLAVEGNDVRSDDELLIVEPKDFPRNGLIFFAPLGVDAKSVVGSIVGADKSTKTVDRFGVKNHARAFDGVTSNISYNRNIPSTPSTITYSVWVKTEEYNDGEILFNNGYRFDLRNDKFNSSYDIRTGISSRVIVDVPFYEYRSGWVNLTASYDLSTAKVYLNGELVYTKSLEGIEIYDFPNSMILGSLSSSSFFLGDIDDILIYNRILNDGEILQLFEQNVTAFMM